jgi:hypothetical protein
MSLVRDHLLSDTAPRYVGDYGELGLDAYNILGIAARYGCDLWVLTDRQWWLVRRMIVVEQCPIRRRHGRREYTEALAYILDHDPLLAGCIVRYAQTALATVYRLNWSA